MQFVVLTHEVEARLGMREQLEQYWAAWRAYGQALCEADVLVMLGGLEPRASDDTLVREDAPCVRVGPDANPRGLPGGYFILEVADLNEAVQWASRCPAATNGTVEVRPVLSEGRARAPTSS